ncbi:RNA polymerase sigma factor SigJ [Actinomadura gamaensis]|uniref:RNA polymerase sigma factor SigJ n=1 Tax=Actinomadura gamaensis TaxID=1763541 RepID=A0ABV9U0R4_9ACTN
MSDAVVGDGPKHTGLKHTGLEGDKLEGDRLEGDGPEGGKLEGDGLEEFERQRGRLFGLAYRLLGSAAEAEDAVQDAYLRWDRADRAQVESPQAWLTKVVTNLCLNRLALARTTRERYLGPWLPEPVLTDRGALGPLETVEQRESVSMGVLVLLETLSPPQRAVFVLREAFGLPYREIADILDVDEASARQLHRRARAHVGDRRKRFEADKARRGRIVERFLAAAATGDLDGLVRLLAEDATAWADGGGRRAARRPVVGRERFARYLLGLMDRMRDGSRWTDALEHLDPAEIGLDLAEVNGEPGVIVHARGAVLLVAVVEVDEDVVTGLQIVLNPAKLRFAAAQRL